MAGMYLAEHNRHNSSHHPRAKKRVVHAPSASAKIPRLAKRHGRGSVRSSSPVCTAQCDDRAVGALD
jgi:hypothetical protein